MKEGLPNSSIDWSNPENHAEQHVIRYEDQLAHASYVDPNTPVIYTVRIGHDVPNGMGGVNHLEQDREYILPYDLVVKIRNHVMFSRKLGMIETGGSEKRANELIKGGNDMVGAPPRYIKKTL